MAQAAQCTLMIQSYFQSGDCGIGGVLGRHSPMRNGAASRGKLQLLANSLRQKNTTGYVATIEKLLTYYPKKSLWQDIISRLQQSRDSRIALRLTYSACGWRPANLSATNDFMEMAQLAISGGLRDRRQENR